MNRKTVVIIIATALITASAAILAHEPVSAFLYRITEPSFGYPVRDGSGRLAIRNDSLGDGEFGARRSGGRSHSGVDISAALGTPVYASKSGFAFRGNSTAGYGRYVIIYHPDGSQTMYGHLSNWAVNTGKRVRKGELLGFVGKTGNAANKNIQPHLHFEIRTDGEPVDPTGHMR